MFAFASFKFSTNSFSTKSKHLSSSSSVTCKFSNLTLSNFYLVGSEEYIDFIRDNGFNCLYSLDNEQNLLKCNSEDFQSPQKEIIEIVRKGQAEGQRVCLPKGIYVVGGKKVLN